MRFGEEREMKNKVLFRPLNRAGEDAGNMKLFLRLHLFITCVLENVYLLCNTKMIILSVSLDSGF